MDYLDHYRHIIEQTLSEYARIPYAHGHIQSEVITDRVNDHYLVVNVGWDNGRRIHVSLVHIDIIDGKVWIQRDGTEQGIALDLVAAGIPKEHIVLGFREPDVRPYTEFAVG